jgi:redox-sensing transcriptional repressor
VFDNAPNRIGAKIGALTVQSMSDLGRFVAKHNVKHAMIAVPSAAAQEVVDLAVRCGICAILCYAPITLSVPDGVHVEYIDPVLHLQRMTYYL